MNTKLTQILLPKFIHCENEPKNGELIHDNRSFIYSPEYLSLVEIIPLDAYQIQYSMDLPQKSFIYTSERYKVAEDFLLVLVQNNIDVVNSTKEIDILQNKTSLMTTGMFLDEAWDYYLDYLKWEDQQS